MGSYLFSNDSFTEISCEDDINTLKYISTKSKVVKIHVISRNREVYVKIYEFFKYIHQKFKFTSNLEKLLLNVSGDLMEHDSRELFLNIQKHLNKFLFNKKFVPRSKINMNNKNDKSNLKFSIKIKFSDAILTIKEVETLITDTPQLNYFSFFSFTRNYTNQQITEFLLNVHICEYDHILPSFLQGDNYLSLFKSLRVYIEKKKLRNIKIPPLVIKSVNIENFNHLKIFLKELNSNQIQINVIDLSFVIFASNPSEIHSQIKFISNSFSINEQTDYIYRFYLFTKFNNLLYLNEIRKMFAKGICLSKPKRNSYFLLYLFIPKYIKLNTNFFNPNYTDILCDLIIKNKDDEDNLKRRSEEWKNRNRNEEYNSDIKSIVMTKHLLKIYTSTNFLIWSFIYSIYSKDSKIKSLKKNSILSIITKFISIRFKEKRYNDIKDPKVKNIVHLSSLQNQVEFKNNFVTFPIKESELHQDLVFLHYDQIFRILRFTK